MLRCHLHLTYVNLINTIILKYQIVTVRNEVAKVMFLHVSVCPRGGEVPGQVPPDQVHPGTRYTSLGPGIPLDQVPPLGPGTPPS